MQFIYIRYPGTDVDVTVTKIRITLHVSKWFGTNNFVAIQEEKK